MRERPLSSLVLGWAMLRMFRTIGLQFGRGRTGRPSHLLDSLPPETLHATQSFSDGEGRENQGDREASVRIGPIRRQYDQPRGSVDLSSMTTVPPSRSGVERSSMTTVLPGRPGG